MRIPCDHQGPLRNMSVMFRIVYLTSESENIIYMWGFFYPKWLYFFKVCICHLEVKLFGKYTYMEKVILIQIGTFYCLVYHTPGIDLTMQETIQIVPYLILKITLEARSFHYLHFKNEEIET